MKYFRKHLFAALGFVVVAGSAAAQAPTEVVATIKQVGQVAETIGGDCVNVTTMMGGGVDPHLYQASAADVQDMQRADIILYSGFGLEG